MQKKKSWKAGDVFLIPLRSELYGVGQIYGAAPKTMNSVLCALFDCQLKEKKEIDFRSCKVITIQFFTRDLLDEGVWEIVDLGGVANDQYMKMDEQVEKGPHIGTKVMGSGLAKDFLRAYFAVDPWDNWHDPTYLDQWLVDPSIKPKNLIYIK